VRSCSQRINKIFSNLYKINKERRSKKLNTLMETTIDDRNLTVSDRIARYIDDLRNRGQLLDKHLLVHQATSTSQIQESYLKEFCDSVLVRDGKADFNIIVLIRLLYLGSNLAQDKIIKIISCLEKYPFWPDGKNTKNEFKKTVFWSENHVLMLLSSAFLFRQYAMKNNLEFRVRDLEIELLKTYLRVHVLFGGLYEALSHCYLPYTLSSLLNLYDFSDDLEIKENAGIVIKIICKQILLSTNILDGSATFTASARTFPRFIMHSYGHNINTLIYILTGKTADNKRKPSAITDFLITTTFPFNDEELRSWFNFSGFQTLRLGHKMEDLYPLYADLAREDTLPLFW